MKSVLISGASVAGPVLAWWLERRGFAVTVVERAPGPRDGGQAVDVRGAALGVLDRMGLLADVQQMRTRMRGMSVLDGDGNEVFRSEERVYSSGRLDGEDLEVLRDDLVRLLHERTRDRVEYRFGDSIASMVDGEDGVRIEFATGEIRTYDAVIGADGLHSNVRRLAFGPEADFLRPLGTALAIFPAENFLGLEGWQLWSNDEGVGYGIYPVRGDRELRVTLGFAVSGPLGLDPRDVEGQKRLVRERFAGRRWETPRLLDAMDAARDFYCDVLAQVRMGGWSRGRVALVGDAGYSPSPMSGQGTSLALVGAYVLAEELGRTGDHREAFARYEARMRPFVDENQALVGETPSGPPSEEAVAQAKDAISLDA